MGICINPLNPIGDEATSICGICEICETSPGAKRPILSAINLRICGFQKPSRSGIERRPRGWLATIHSAAFTAPKAKPSRENARCSTVMASTGDVQVTIWVPGTSPSRSWPMSSADESAAASASSSVQRVIEEEAAIRVSAVETAVPDGWSSLWIWWISFIAGRYSG